MSEIGKRLNTSQRYKMGASLWYFSGAFHRAQEYLSAQTYVHEKAQIVAFLTSLLGVYKIHRGILLFLSSTMVNDTTAVTAVVVWNVYRMNHRNRAGKHYKNGDSLIQKCNGVGLGEDPGNYLVRVVVLVMPTSRCAFISNTCKKCLVRDLETLLLFLSLLQPHCATTGGHLISLCTSFLSARWRSCFHNSQRHCEDKIISICETIKYCSYEFTST